MAGKLTTLFSGVIRGQLFQGPSGG